MIEHFIFQSVYAYQTALDCPWTCWNTSNRKMFQIFLCNLQEPIHLGSGRIVECFSLKGTWAESEICAWKLAGIDDTIDSGVSFGYWIWGQCYVVLEITAKKMETQIYFVKMSFRCYKIIGVTIFSQKILLPVSVRENEQKQMRRHFNTKEKLETT